MTSEQQASGSAIRELVERWAKAVQARDLSGVPADHADDIVMFDVPPAAGPSRTSIIPSPTGADRVG